MKISQNQLRKIIIEEYIKEEGLDESQAAEDLLRQILGDEEYERRRALDNPDSRGGDTKPMKKSNKAAETTPLPGPEASSEANPVKSAVDGIYELVSDMNPEDVAEIFQIVFEKLPGVEMEKEPEIQSLYSPGAEGRPQVGLREYLINKAYARILEMAGIPYNRDEDDDDENFEEDSEEDV